MISREFVSWLASNWLRTTFMALIAAIIAFGLVMSVGLHVYQAQLIEQQIRQIAQINEEANTARQVAAKAQLQADKTQSEIKAIEKTIDEDR